MRFAVLDSYIYSSRCMKRASRFTQRRNFGRSRCDLAQIPADQYPHLSGSV